MLFPRRITLFALYKFAENNFVVAMGLRSTVVHLICLIYLVETVAKFVTSYLLHLVKDINRKFSHRIGPKRAIFCFFSVKSFSHSSY